MGFYTDRKGVRYARATVSGKTRKNVRLEHPEAEARQRAELIDKLAEQLRDAGQNAFIEKVVEQVATLPKERLPELAKIVAGIVSGKEKLANAAPGGALGLTLSQVAKQWTSGELAKKYPDHVQRKRSSAGDASHLAFVVKTVGDLPVTSFRHEHAEQVMAALPANMRPATRRQYAQVMSRLMKMCVYPLKLITTNPLPSGFLPRIKKDKGKQVIFPDEEAKLLGCTKVPLVYRVLYGFLARMGFRISEAIGSDDEDIPALTWDRFDLERGLLHTTRSKNEIERYLALPKDVHEALVEWKKVTTSTEVFPIEATGDTGMAVRFREDLKAAGVNRSELFARTVTSHPIRAHDLRALFVTVAIAQGKSEFWIRDFTGHKTMNMIEAYRRHARQLQSIGRVELAPMTDAIPEFRERWTVADAPPEPTELHPKTTESPEVRASWDGQDTGRGAFDSPYRGSNPCLGTEVHGVQLCWTECTKVHGRRSREVNRAGPRAAEPRSEPRRSTGGEAAK